MNCLILPLVQEIEDAYPGMGVYAFFIACKLSGLKHLGSRLLQQAKLATHSTSKLVSLTDAYNQKYNGPGVSLTQAIVKRFKDKYVVKWTVPRLRDALRKLNPECPKDLYKRMDKHQLLKEIYHSFSKISNDEMIETWIENDTFEEINDQIAYTLSEQIFVGNDNEGCDISALAASGGVKCIGRDAVTLLESGGGENMIRMLSRHRQGFILQNHEQCDKIIQQLTHNERFFDTKIDEKKMLLKNLLQLKNYEGECLDEPEEFNFNALFGAIETETEAYDDYKEDAIKLGNDLLKLYQRPTDDANREELVELEPLAQQTLQVFQAVKAIALPIMKPMGATPAELVASMDGHDERCQHLLDILNSSAKIKFKLGDHSDYIHWMIAHAKDDCVRSVKRFGLHLSHFSCQTSEHFNKVLKRMVERLHGFSIRSVSIKQPWKNKFGFIMSEYMLRFLHFFDTIVPKRFQSCSICRQQGHNNRTCPSREPI